MYSPTHVNVVVQRAENLLIKGKNGTNNSFVVISLGKERYRTSIKEKSEGSVIWNEECEFKIPKVGNKAAVELTAYHRNSLNLDQFLGQVRIPLSSFEKFQKTIQWYTLQGKPGKKKEKDKNRGELEVQIAFLFKPQSQSLTSLQSKGSVSFQQLTGSLFSLRQGKKLNVKKLAKKVFNKNKIEVENSDNFDKTYTNLNNNKLVKKYGNLDPGVISDEEDNGSYKSVESLGNILESPTPESQPTPSPKPRRVFTKNPEISISQWEDNTLQSISSLNVSQVSVNSTGSRKEIRQLDDLRGRLSDRRLSISCLDFSHFSSPKPEKKFASTLQLGKNLGESSNRLTKLAKKFKNFHSADKKEGRKHGEFAEFDGGLEINPALVKSEFKNKNKEELINMVVDLQKRVNCISVRVKDLEEYLDKILLKVMETVPKILEKS